MTMTKAEAYAKVREKIALRFGSNVAEEIFSEFEETEDEMVREALVEIFSLVKENKKPVINKEDADLILAWLEKQDKHPNNEEAEKEKYDYVSCQSLYCKGSFNEFKEGESYWLEYVGNDNYIGRSDNILNQKFHITPRQLYTWLDPTCGYMHCENDTDENSAPRECGKSEDEVIRNCIGMCLTDASERRFKDYNTSLKECLDWLEKQGNSNSQNWKPSKEQINALEHFVRSIAESGYASPYDDNTKLLKSLINDLHKLEKQKDINALIQQAYKQGYTEGQRVERKHWLEKQDEQKPILDFKASNWYVSKVDGKIHDLTYNPTDKTEPKFRVGDVMRTIQESANGMVDGMPVIISIDKEYYHCTNELIAIKDQDDYEYPPMNRATSWSEEDECIYQSIIDDTVQENQLDSKQIDWLKSLRLQRQWKPSNEQMEVLLSEVTGWKKGCPKQIVLESLYNDLKKLK